MIEIDPVQVRRTLVRSLGFALLLATRLATAQSAAPDCPEQDATICGRHHFAAGTQAFEKGDFTAAAGEFEAALAQRPHPVIRFNLALSWARLGRPSAAISLLRQVQEDAEADKELKERAAREQRSVEQSLARVTFALSDPKREHVELDGVATDLSAQRELALDPGSHHVRVISNGAVVLDQELELSAGERVELRVGERSRRIDVVVVPTVAPPPLPVTRPTPPPPAVKPRATLARVSPAWFYGALGVTAVVTGLTVWSGIDTKNAYSDYERDLPDLSQREADERVSAGHARELRTNLLLAGSLVCGAGSAVLGVWFVDFSHGRRASLGVAPHGVALSGRF